MFKNVLVGVDGGPHGRDAIALASRLTDPQGKLTLANVDSAGLRPSGAVSPIYVREEREASAHMLEEERAAVGAGAGAAELITLVGLSPGATLHLRAEEQQADLLVVGSCSHGTFGRAMLGDDTRAALNGAPCAVAIASVGYAEDPKPIGKIGVAYNGSPESNTALAVARELAAQTDASVRALEVVSIPTYAFTGVVAAAFGDGIDEMLKDANSRLKELPDVDGEAVYGLAGEELAAFGDEVDILIVGSRGYGPIRRLVLGSTSTYLQRHARCPLLVLPRAAGPHENPTTAGELHAETTAGAVA